MYIRSRWYLLALSVSLTGCTSFKEVERTNRLYLDEQKRELIAGLYESMPARVGEIEYLREPISAGNISDQHFLFNRFKLSSSGEYSGVASDYLVQLEPINKNTIHLNLIEDSKIIKTRKIKGRYEDGYFYIRRKFIVVPFFPLLFGYRVQRQRIGLENGHLVVDLRRNIWMSFLVAGRSENSQQEARYRKINAKPK